MRLINLTNHFRLLLVFSFFCLGILSAGRLANMLYFGNFLQIDKELFIGYLNDLKADQNRLYEDLGRDLYNLGLVLRKKYYLLSISYNIFVGGLVLSVLSFIIIYLI